MIEEKGVHWGWFVFWIVVFWPAVIITWIISSKKVNKARLHNAHIRHTETLAALKN